MNRSTVAQHVGASTNICHYSSSLFEVVNYLSRHFKIIEIELENQSRYLFESDKCAFAKEIKKLLQLKNAKGLNFCLHAPYLGSETDLSGVNPAIRQEAIWRMMELLELAIDLNSDNVTYSLHFVNKKTDQQILLNNLYHSLAKLALYAEKLHIQIVLEYIPMQTDNGIVLAELFSLCRRFNFKLALNISQYIAMYDSDEWHHSVLASLLPYLEKVYIANSFSIGRKGENNFFYQKILSYLNRHHFKGLIIIERKDFLSGFCKEDSQLLINTVGFKDSIINVIE